MRRITLAALIVAAILRVVEPHVALAQDAGPATPAATPAEDVQVDPTTGERWRAVRPEDGLRRGLLPVSAWLAITAGALIAVGAVAALVLRARSARRDARGRR